MNLHKIHIGVPSPRYGLVFPLDKSLHEWTELDQFANDRSHSYDVAVKVDTNANKIEQSRSALIHMAKLQGADCHGQFDADQTPQNFFGHLQPFKQVMALLREDFERFDIICAPTIAMDGSVMLWNFEGELPPDPAHVEEAFPITSGSAGHFFLSKNYLDTVEPIDTFRYLNKTTMEEYPLYLRNPENGDDSNSFYHEARKQEFRIGADPRIWDTHWKFWPMSLTMPHQFGGSRTATATTSEGQMVRSQ